MWVYIAIGCIMRDALWERHTCWRRGLLHCGYIMRHALWVFQGLCCRNGAPIFRSPTQVSLLSSFPETPTCVPYSQCFSHYTPNRNIQPQCISHITHPIAIYNHNAFHILHTQSQYITTMHFTYYTTNRNIQPQCISHITHPIAIYTHNSIGFVLNQCATRVHSRVGSVDSFSKIMWNICCTSHRNTKSDSEVSLRTEVLIRTSDAAGWRCTEQLFSDVYFLWRIHRDFRYLKDIELLRSVQ
jgi:hypothetical protein